jgi:hypothetical protein
MTSDRHYQEESVSVKQVQNLYQLSVYSRWLVVGLCWLILAPLGIWGLREEISLWRDYFTWTAVRYGLAYNFWPTLCLAVCLGVTAGVLVGQSKRILFGISPREKYRLQQQVRRIKTAGPTHPLWRWVVGR